MTLNDVDMLVMTGTGMLGDFGILPLDLHYDILRWSLIAKLCRCKLLFVSVGVGPIRHPLSRLFVKAVLALADYRSYRDEFSREYLKGIGFNSRDDAVFPDLAFSFPTDAFTSNTRGNHAPVVGVGLMTYYDRRMSSDKNETLYREYLAKMGSFVMWLVQNNYAVRVLIGDAVYDHRVRQDLKSLLNGRGIIYEQVNIVDEPANSVDDVLSQLATTDLVIASRFHNVLLALMITKLVVAISYHEKVGFLMGAVGLSEFSQDIEDLDVEKLVSQCVNMINAASVLRPQIERGIEAYRRALDNQYERIFKG